MVWKLKQINISQRVGYAVEDREASWILYWTPDLADWLRTLAGIIVFLGKTLYSEIASLPRCINNSMLEINLALDYMCGTSIVLHLLLII